MTQGLVGQPPWHLWGQKRTVEVNSGTFPSEQFARVSYKRPETWRFFLAAELLSGPVGAISDSVVTVDWQFQFGVGLSVWSSLFVPGVVEGFAEFRWLVPVGVTPGRQAGNKKFASQVLGPILDDSVGATSRQVIQTISAQDIQVTATLSAASDPSAIPFRVELTSFFSPNVHVRPDWFVERDDQAFLGGETNGK